MSKENLTIPQVFHKLRNTYQVLYSYLGTPEEESLFTPQQVMEYLERDLELMLEAEKSCKICYEIKEKHSGNSSL